MRQTNSIHTMFSFQVSENPFRIERDKVNRVGWQSHLRVGFS